MKPMITFLASKAPYPTECCENIFRHFFLGKMRISDVISLTSGSEFQAPRMYIFEAKHKQTELLYAVWIALQNRITNFLNIMYIDPQNPFFHRKKK